MRACAERGLEGPASGRCSMTPRATGPRSATRGRTSRASSRSLEELEARGAKAMWVGVDLEPPLARRSSARAPAARARCGARSAGTLMRRASIARIGRVPRRARADPRARRARRSRPPCRSRRGISGGARPVWQDALEAPWDAIGWDRAGRDGVRDDGRGVLARVGTRAGRARAARVDRASHERVIG